MRPLLIAAVLSLGACGDRPDIAERSAASPAPLECCVSELQQPDAVRFRVDSARNRLWVLGPEHVAVYDRSTRGLVRRIEWSGWNIAEFVCQPGLALDRSGAAFISDNVQPRVWRIDPDSFEIREHAIRLVGREQLDIGFGELAFGEDGALYGVAATGASAWSIELASSRAYELPGAFDARLRQAAQCGSSRIFGDNGLATPSAQARSTPNSMPSAPAAPIRGSG